MPKPSPPLHSEEFCRRAEREWKALFAVIIGAAALVVMICVL